jgi:hypothetical protein
VENREQFLASDTHLQDIRARAVAVVKKSTERTLYRRQLRVLPSSRLICQWTGWSDDRGNLWRRMSASSGELAAVVGDHHRFYRRLFVKNADDAH